MAVDDEDILAEEQRKAKGRLYGTAFELPCAVPVPSLAEAQPLGGEDPLRVAVTGGSLAGLATAAVLRMLGAEVTVFERSARLGEEPGGGIVLQPALSELLKAVGAPHLDSVSVPTRGRTFLNIEGEVIESPRTVQAMTGWEPLWRRLRSLLPDDCWRDGLDVRDIVSDGFSGKAMLDLQRWGSGMEVQAGPFDLVVGADGVGSSVRSAVAGAEANHAAYSGYIAWRGVVHEQDLPESLVEALEEEFTFYMGPQTHMLVYMIPSPTKEVWNRPLNEQGVADALKSATMRGGRCVNWVWYWNVPQDRLPDVMVDATGWQRHFSVPRGQLGPAAIEKMRAASEALPPQFRLLLEATKEPFMQPIYDLAAGEIVRKVSEDAWGILVGDAACILRTHTAYGTAKAMEDALELAKQLQVFGKVRLDDALMAWQEARAPRHRHLVSYGMHLGKTQERE